MDRTIKPRGTIQKPRIGRKPKTPPTVSKMPMAILASLLAGSLKVRPAMVIFGMGINWGLSEKIARSFDISGKLFSFSVRKGLHTKQTFAIRLFKYSPIAQLVEQAAVNRFVASSSLARGAKLQKGRSLRSGLFYFASLFSRQTVKAAAAIIMVAPIRVLLSGHSEKMTMPIRLA